MQRPCSRQGSAQRFSLIVGEINFCFSAILLPDFERKWYRYRTIAPTENDDVQPEYLLVLFGTKYPGQAFNDLCKGLLVNRPPEDVRSFLADDSIFVMWDNGTMDFIER